VIVSGAAADLLEIWGTLKVKDLMSKLIVMGVSGAGKSTLGQALATKLDWRFLDADDFHTDAAKAKIASGRILDEFDRSLWLAAIKPVFDDTNHSSVLACSALRSAHRASLNPDILVHLVISPDLALERLQLRKGHFAGPSIAASQFATLENPQDAIHVPAQWPTQRQVQFVCDQMEITIPEPK
jgi:gluconokinase